MKFWHADMSARVRNLLIAQGRHAGQGQGVRLGHRKVRFPEVVCFREPPDPDQGRYDPTQLSLVVEVISADSEEEDRVTKPYGTG